MVADGQVVDTVETYDAGGGQLLVRVASTDTPLSLTGGSLQGTIEARDGSLAALRGNVNSLASLLITEVNTVHGAGFSLTGSTGEAFFLGTNAANIQVNTALQSNPALVQAAGVAGAPGDNQVALALAELSQKAHAALNNQTFNEGYGQAQAVAGFGQALSSVNTQLSDQELVEGMMKRQRDSISGVSLDEEMADLTRFQRAFEASARLITTVDELLQTVVNMKR
jgi:flagellar hook-associated protein 1 FlgK